MNPLNNYNFRYFAAIALLTALLAVLAKFDGTVTVQVTPLSLRIVVNNRSAGCPMDLPLPEQKPKLPEQKLA